MLHNILVPNKLKKCHCGRAITSRGSHTSSCMAINASVVRQSLLSVWLDTSGHRQFRISISFQDMSTNRIKTPFSRGAGAQKVSHLIEGSHSCCVREKGQAGRQAGGRAGGQAHRNDQGENCGDKTLPRSSSSATPILRAPSPLMLHVDPCSLLATALYRTVRD